MRGSGVRSRGFLLLAVLLIAAVVVGGLIASFTKTIPYAAWLSYSRSFGLDVNKPALLNLSVLKVAFGFQLDISVAQVICLLAAVFVYRRLR